MIYLCDDHYHTINDDNEQIIGGDFYGHDNDDKKWNLRVIWCRPINQDVLDLLRLETYSIVYKSSTIQSWKPSLEVFWSSFEFKII